MGKKRGQNEGSIRQRKNGLWEARVSVGVKPDGKLNRRSIYGKTKKEVHEKLVKLQNQINENSYNEPSKLTLEHWLKIWLWDYKKNSIKPSTFERYEKDCRNHIIPNIGKVLLKDLKTFHIQHLINEKHKSGLSPRSVKYIHTTLYNALELAFKHEQIPSNICKAVILPKQIKKQIQVLSLEDQKKFIQAIKGHKFETAFLLTLSTGLRLGEILALQWSNVDLKNKILYVKSNIQRLKTYNTHGNKTELVVQNSTKSKSGERSIPLLDKTAEFLVVHKAHQEEEKKRADKLYNDNDFVFCDPLGKVIEPRRFTVHFDKILKEAEIDKITFHGLRHTFATRGLENGVNPKIMQEILGHTSITMTLDLYSHVLPETKSSEMQKLKNIFD